MNFFRISLQEIINKTSPTCNLLLFNMVVSHNNVTVLPVSARQQKCGPSSYSLLLVLYPNAMASSAPPSSCFLSLEHTNIRLLIITSARFIPYSSNYM